MVVMTKSLQYPSLRSSERILTTHTGSLPRPSELALLHITRSKDQLVDPEVMREFGKRAVHKVVAQQIAARIDIGNDGEQQRDSFLLHVLQRLSGFGGQWNREVFADLAKYPDYLESERKRLALSDAISVRRNLPKAIAEIQYLGTQFITGECRDLADAVMQNPGLKACFVTSPSPGIIAACMKNEFYSSNDEYIGALGSALAQEYTAIVDHGFLLQIDCPELALERHVGFQNKDLADFLRFGEKVVAALNESISTIPRDQVRLHVCWGNYEGPHDEDVPLEAILDILCSANVGTFVLPLANPRHAHEYRLLPRLLGADRTIVAGVIDTTTNYIEHPAVVADRICKVAETIGDPTRVIAGTDCGFETVTGASGIAPSIAWAKLASLAQGAQLASDRLFR
jgi:5-methyltetrahydropteroyltriglutamate--homocysteine methyltransferase